MDTGHLEGCRDYEARFPCLYTAGGSQIAVRKRWRLLTNEIAADGFTLPVDVQPESREQPRLMQYSFGIYVPFRFRRQ